jgi:glycosyltransferase Alg8
LAPHERPAVFVVITSYRMDLAVTGPVYDALFTEAGAYGAPVTIVAAVTDAGEMRFLEARLAAAAPGPRVQLVLMRQAGTGKRDAMAEALRAAARRAPRPRDVVVLMDGDSLLTPGSLAKCAALFVAQPDLGALTTDNFGIVKGNDWVKEWYDLRFATRHVHMSSVALGRRLLVLTGRFSMFRADVAVSPPFIAFLQNDWVDHWRHGRFKFLTGDDKSTWFFTLAQGWRMLYAADVKTGCFESLPDPRFTVGSTKLMFRWFGNMLRSNGRAVALGPRRVGLMTWVSLVDQRVAMWTALCGPFFCILSALTRTPYYLAAYAAWVVASRLVAGLATGLVRRRLSPYYPVLLYYTQVYGALLKIYVSFRLDRQSWTRQGIGSARAGGAAAFWNRYYTAFAAVAFLAVMAVVGGALPVPGWRTLGLLAGGKAGGWP